MSAGRHTHPAPWPNVTYRVRQSKRTHATAWSHQPSRVHAAHGPRFCLCHGESHRATGRGSRLNQVRTVRRPAPDDSRARRWSTSRAARSLDRHRQPRQPRVYQSGDGDPSQANATPSWRALPLDEILGHEIHVEMILPTGPLELTRPIFIVMLRGDPHLTLTPRLRGHIGPGLLPRLLPHHQVHRVIHVWEHLDPEGFQDHQADIEGIDGTLEEVPIRARVMPPLLREPIFLHLFGQPLGIEGELALPIPHDDSEGGLQAKVNPARAPRRDHPLHVEEIPRWGDGVLNHDPPHPFRGSPRDGLILRPIPLLHDGPGALQLGTLSLRRTPCHLGADFRIGLLPGEFSRFPRIHSLSEGSSKDRTHLPLANLARCPSCMGEVALQGALKPCFGGGGGEASHPVGSTRALAVQYAMFVSHTRLRMSPVYSC